MATVGRHPTKTGYTYWVYGPAPGSPVYVTVLEAIAVAEQQGFDVEIDPGVWRGGPDSVDELGGS